LDVHKKTVVAAIIVPDEVVFGKKLALLVL